MMKPAKQRNDEETRFLKDAFSSIKFFIEVHEEIPNELLMKLYKELRHEFYARRGKVFEIGDKGTKFYIILKGTAYVLLRKEGFTENVEDITEIDEMHKFSTNENHEEKLIDNILSTKEILQKEGPFPHVTEEHKTKALQYLALQLKEFEKCYSKKNYSEKDHNKIAKCVKKLKSLDVNAQNMHFHYDRVRFPDNFLNILNDKDYLTLLYPNLILSKELITGDTFGELALRRSIPRFF